MIKEFKDFLKQAKHSRFYILVGNCQKLNLEFVESLADGYDCVVCGTKVDDVRQIIKMSYTLTGNTAYIFPDADNMTLAAKNALLKVTEEPPRKAIFIMCISSPQNMIGTLLSRATVYKVPPLTKEEISEYVLKNYPSLNSRNFHFATSYCRTYEQVDKFLKLEEPEEMISFVEKVVSDLSEITVTNALKILTYLAIKDTDDKGRCYDVEIFLEIFKEKVTDYFLDDFLSVEQFEGIMAATLEVSQKIGVSVFNKQGLLDVWMLKIWEIFGGENIE